MISRLISVVFANFRKAKHIRYVNYHSPGHMVWRVAIDFDLQNGGCSHWRSLLRSASKISEK